VHLLLRWFLLVLFLSVLSGCGGAPIAYIAALDGDSSSSGEVQNDPIDDGGSSEPTGPITPGNEPIGNDGNPTNPDPVADPGTPGEQNQEPEPEPIAEPEPS